jgi:hypothetical protein
MWTNGGGLTQLAMFHEIEMFFKKRYLTTINTQSLDFSYPTEVLGGVLSADENTNRKRPVVQFRRLLSDTGEGEVITEGEDVIDLKRGEDVIDLKRER